MRSVSLLPLLALVLTGACTTPTQIQGIEASLDDIQRQVFKLQKDSTSQVEALESVRQAVLTQEGHQRTGWADLQVQVDELSRGMRVLEEQLQETQVQLRELTEEMRRARHRLTLAEPGPPPAATAGDGGGEATPEPADRPTTVPSGPEELFNGAYADYSKRNYPLALWSFGELLRRYPDSSLSDDSQFWIGECHYAQGDFPAAIKAFEQVIDRYPSGDKIPAAHLKAGLAYFELKQTAQGVLQLQHVVEAFPGSDEARIAREQLRRRGLSGA